MDSTLYISNATTLVKQTKTELKEYQTSLRTFWHQPRSRTQRINMVISTPLCVNGCGFYGSAETKNLCSKCYKSELSKTNDPTSSAAQPASVSVDSAPLVSSPSKLNNRCESCNKKLGLMGFTCRCGKVFCHLHRYPSEHPCNYDFKKADRQVLAKENPVIKGDKMKSRM